MVSLFFARMIKHNIDYGEISYMFSILKVINKIFDLSIGGITDRN